MPQSEVHSVQTGIEPYLHFLPIIVGFSLTVFLLGISSVQFANAFGFVGIFSFATVIFVVIQLGAMWAVLGPGKYWRSASLSFLACAVPGLSSLMSLAIVFGSSALRDVVAIAAFAPMAWLLAQIPFLYLKLFFQWRITNEKNRPDEPLTISELLVFTGFVAIGLALMRGLVTGSEFNSQRQQITFVWEFLVPCSMFLLVSFLFVCLPAMNLYFAEKATTNRTPGTILVGVAIALLFVLGILFSGAQLLLVMIWLFVLFAGGFLFPIHMHRQNGFFIAKGRPTAGAIDQS